MPKLFKNIFHFTNSFPLRQH